MSDVEQIRRFCSALFGGPDGSGDDRLAGLHIAAAWSLPGRETRWRSADDLDAIVSAITELAEGQSTAGGAEGIYLGAGLTRKDKGRYKRPGSDDVVAIPGFWADIDVAGGPHESKPYPPDIDSAVKLAYSTGIAPTAIIRTGFGIHAWWLFPEPFIIEPGDDEAGEIAKLAAISRDWSSTLRYQAERLGRWKIDSVFNLDRVMRVPGTMNQRVKGDPRPCVILEMHEERRYELDDLVEVMADRDVLDSYQGGGPAGKVVELQGINLTQTWARVNSAAYRETRYTPDWLQAILDIDGDAGTFSLTWAGKRNEFLKDQSSYEASIARTLHDFGCSVEYQVEAIMCARLRSGEKVDKVDPTRRTDYIARTIGFIQASAARGQAPSAIEAQRDAATESAASGRLVAAVEVEPEPEPPAIEWEGPTAPPEDDEDPDDHVEPPEDAFATYVSALVEHSSTAPTVEDRVEAAAAQVEAEHQMPDEDRTKPVVEPAAPNLDPLPEPNPEDEAWGHRSEAMVGKMEALSDLLFPESYRKRGFEVWRLERQDQGEGARGRLAVKVPVDYDWPEANRPENYRVNRPLFTEWYKRGDFATPRGFRNAIMNDCLIIAAPVKSKEEWAVLIDTLVPFWLRDSSGADLAYAVNDWLLEYLLDHPATPDEAEAMDMRKPFLRDHHEWGKGGLPLIYFSLDPFLSFVASRPGGPKGRQAKGITKYLHVQVKRLHMVAADGKKKKPTMYEVEHSQFNHGDWQSIIETAREAFNSREQRRHLRVVGDAS